jgi:type IV pilus assembly protein PilM
VIGLDIGTHAVRAAELSFGRGQPVLERMGQVALPPGAVVAGEVVDTGAVSAALRRLWRDAAFSSRNVVVGVANARVVARMTEMPALPEAELRSSLPFHVQELIPIPVDEAQLDFQVTEHLVTESGEERVKLMLVAAQRAMLRSLLAAVSGAGLVAIRVDLVALALIRALSRPETWLEAIGPEGAEGASLGAAGPSGSTSQVIIGIGAGVTNVVVHEHGIPSFVRTVPTGGKTVTDALAIELGVPTSDAEGLKRLASGEDASESVAEATSMAIAPVVGEVVGSLDFARLSSRPGGVAHVQLSGGGSRLEPLRRSLADQLRVPIDIGDPYEGLKIGKVGIDPVLVQRSGDLFTVAIGLALSGGPLDGGARRITLLPGDVAAKRAEQRQVVMAAAGVGVFALLLVGAGIWRGRQADSIRADTKAAQAEMASVQSSIAKLADVEKLQTDIALKQRALTAALTGDLAWPTMIRDLSTALPADVALTSLTATAAKAGQPGTLTFAGVAGDHNSVAAFLDSVSKLKQVDRLWLASSTRSEGVGPATFSATAQITDAAVAKRVTDFGGTK